MKIHALLLSLALTQAILTPKLYAQSLGGTLYAGGSWAQVRDNTLVSGAGALLELPESTAQGTLQLLPRMQLGRVDLNGEFWFEGTSAERTESRREAKIQRLSAEYPLGSEWLLSLGKRLFHSGTAYVWNPSNPFTDPNVNNLDRGFPYFREGDPFAAAEWLGATDSFAVQAFNWLPSDPLYGEAPGRERSLGLRWEHVLEAADVTAVLARRDGENFASLAGSLSLGERLELHGEVALHDRRRTQLPVARSVALPMGGSAGYFELAATDKGATIGQVLIGGQYTFPNQTNVIVEYFYNGEGYSSAEFNRLKAAVDAAEQGTHDPISGAPNRGFLAGVAGLSGRMRRNYLFGRVAVPDLIHGLELHTFLRWGLDDDARVVGLLATAPLPGGLELRASAEHFSGPANSEAELIPFRWRASLSLSLSF